MKKNDTFILNYCLIAFCSYKKSITAKTEVWYSLIIRSIESLIKPAGKVKQIVPSKSNTADKVHRKATKVPEKNEKRIQRTEQEFLLVTPFLKKKQKYDKQITGFIYICHTLIKAVKEKWHNYLLSLKEPGIIHRKSW